jgi:hypothetical protein
MPSVWKVTKTGVLAEKEQHSAYVPQAAYLLSDRFGEPLMS